MVYLKIERLCVCAALAFSSTFLFSSCVNENYDLSKDIDLTMGLGAEGLQLKVGNTAPIPLSEILKTDDSFHTDNTNTFYLEENGKTQFEFNIPSISTSLSKEVMQPKIRLFDYTSIGGSGQFPPGDIAVTNVNGSDNMSFTATGIPNIVNLTQAIYPTTNSISLKLKFITSRPEIKLHFKKINNLTINFPQYINIDGKGNSSKTIPQWTGNSENVDLGIISFASINPNGDIGQAITNSTMNLDGNISIKGDFTVEAANTFQLKAGDYIDLQLSASIEGSSNGEIAISKIRGIFDPDINPQINPIEISNSIPDFLKDSEVVIKAANPTLNFNIDMTSIPVSLDLNGIITAKRNGSTSASVRIPESGSIKIDNNAQNNIYFYQDQNGPYSPTSIPSNAKQSKVNTLSSLIEKIPDYINADFSNGKIKVTKDLYTVQLGHTYGADIDYHIFVPLEFNKGLKIVYTDSIKDLNKDLYKYQADGAIITANILSTIPLDLKAHLIALDINGNEIKEIKISDAIVKSGTANGTITAVELDASFSSPSDLSRIDKLQFRVDAEANIPEGSKSALVSTQYLQVKDMRLRLKGQVIGNFN